MKRTKEEYVKAWNYHVEQMQYLFVEVDGDWEKSQLLVKALKDDVLKAAAKLYETND
jgi:hypothetical protein